jgi:hypothetical protein
VLFVPVAVRGERLVDGALVEPVPVDAARDLGATLVIAVDVAYRPHEEEASGLTAYAFQAMHILVNSLAANTAYTYKFTAGRDTIEGRTHTAPDANADVQVNLAWVSCQDYSAGHFTAYRQMIADDRDRDPADRIQFVVHLGDVIYETIGETSQRPVNSTFQFISLKNADGSPRVPPAFPQGTRDGIVTRASTLAELSSASTSSMTTGVLSWAEAGDASVTSTQRLRDPMPRAK